MEPLTAGPTDDERKPPRRADAQRAHLTLRRRLSLLVVAGAVFVALVSTLAAVSFVRLIDARHAILNKVDPASLQVDTLLIGYLNQETGLRGYLLSRDPAFLRPYETGMVQQRHAINALRRLLADQPDLLARLAATEAIAEGWQREVARPAIAAVGAGNAGFATSQALAHSKDVFDSLRKSLAGVSSALASQRRSAGGGLNSATIVLMVVTFVSLAVGVVLGLLTFGALRRWVTGPLLALGADAREVAAGRVTHEIVPTGPPEIGQLGSDMEAMRVRIVDEYRAADAARSELAERNADLARSNQELEQFAYVASHDLQEPLRKVTSFVQLLHDRYHDRLDNVADQYMEYAVDGAKRMQRLINDLLAFSRVGRSTEHFVDIDLADTVAVATRNLSAALEEAGAHVDVGPLPVVVGAAGLLSELWQNLIGNSVKFRSAEQPVIEVRAVRSVNDWTLSVTDNGIGIEPRFAEKVFVIFQRLHSREDYAGTGIGLALCKKIVEFHGGHMWVDVAHHPGARICFSLPAKASGDVNDPRTHGASPEPVAR
jgi:signal transduction histidine kinase